MLSVPLHLTLGRSTLLWCLDGLQHGAAIRIAINHHHIDHMINPQQLFFFPNSVAVGARGQNGEIVGKRSVEQAPPRPVGMATINGRIFQCLQGLYGPLGPGEVELQYC